MFNNSQKKPERMGFSKFGLKQHFSYFLNSFLQAETKEKLFFDFVRNFLQIFNELFRWKKSPDYLGAKFKNSEYFILPPKFFF